MTRRATSEAEELLKNRGVTVDAIGVFAVGNEMILGELQAPDYKNINARNLLSNTPLVIRNPKRFLRLQRVVGVKSVDVEFLVGDLDMISGGLISIVPTMAYLLRHLDDESRTEYLNLYADYVEARMVAKAEAAGLHLPR